MSAVSVAPSPATVELSSHLGEALPPFLAAVVCWWGYRRRSRRLAAQQRPVPRWRVACFAAGLVTTVAAVSPPLDELSDQLLLAHMAQHLLLADLGALLLVLGLTGPMLAPLLSLPVLGRLRALAHPAVALPLWAVDLYLWHLPALYQAALRHATVHALEHAMFLAFGLNMWMALLGPLPKPEWFGNLARLGYVVGVRMAGAVLAIRRIGTESAAATLGEIMGTSFSPEEAWQLYLLGIALAAAVQVALVVLASVAAGALALRK